MLVLGGVSTDEVSPATALLAAIREVWPEDADRLATHQLADLLAEHESREFTWPEQVRTRELNARMRDLGISPVPMRINGTVMRGYDRETVTGEAAVTPDEPVTSSNAPAATVTPSAQGAQAASGNTRPLPVSHDQLDGMARRGNGRKHTKTSSEEETK